jgi:hypothetical protein
LRSIAHYAQQQVEHHEQDGLEGEARCWRHVARAATRSGLRPLSEEQDGVETPPRTLRGRLGLWPGSACLADQSIAEGRFATGVTLISR